MKITLDLDPLVAYQLTYLGIMTQGWQQPEKILIPLIQAEYHRILDLRKTATESKGGQP
jgi:hypothetical protein